jgi:hypothetical protein
MELILAWKEKRSITLISVIIIRLFKDTVSAAEVIESNNVES